MSEKTKSVSRMYFLMSQGWALLVREEPDGLWRSPQGGVMRAAEAEESAMMLMTAGLVHWFTRGEEQTGVGKTGAELVRARIAQMVFREVAEMVKDPAVQRDLAAAAVGTLTAETVVTLRTALRALLDAPPAAAKPN